MLISASEPQKFLCIAFGILLPLVEANVIVWTSSHGGMLTLNNLRKRIAIACAKNW